MELIWNEINALQLILHSAEQEELEGELPLPAGRTAAEILDYSAQVTVDGCRLESGRMSVDGRITATLLAVDDAGDTFSFVSESPFSHSLVNAALESGMLGEASASLTLLSVRRAPDGRLLLSAVIDLDCFVTSAASLRTLGGVSGVRDMELKTRTASLTRRKELGSAIISVSDELSSGGADTVLTSRVRLSVRDTAFENGGVTVTGTASVSALCKSADGELLQLVRSIPFRESVQTDGMADDVYATAELRSSSVRALGTEFSLIAVEAAVELRVFALRTEELVLPLDAFSPSINFNCIRRETELLSPLGQSELTHTVRENLPVPDGMVDIFTALSVSARPVVTSSRVVGSELQLEGLLPTCVVYRTGGGKLDSFSDEVPFSLRMAAPAGAEFARVAADCSCSVTGGSGRAAQITYSIDCSAEFYGLLSTELAVGLAEQNAANKGAENFVPEAFSGLIIHTASEEETVFDVAKRFRIPSARVRELNPECADRFNEGTKVLLIV